MKTSHRPAAHQPTTHYALDAHHRVSIGCLVALVAAILLHGHVRTSLLLVLTWEAFALTSLVLAWHIISFKEPYEARLNARLQDGRATFLFALVICAATGFVIFLPGWSERLKFTNALVAHAHLAMAGLSFWRWRGTGRCCWRPKVRLRERFCMGRTARAGASGIAYAFCDPSEQAFLRAIQRLTGVVMHVAGPHPVSSTGGPQADIVPIRPAMPQAPREGALAEQDRPKRRG